MLPGFMLSHGYNVLRIRVKSCLVGKVDDVVSLDEGFIRVLRPKPAWELHGNVKRCRSGLGHGTVVRVRQGFPDDELLRFDGLGLTSDAPRNRDDFVAIDLHVLHALGLVVRFRPQRVQVGELLIWRVLP